MDYPKSVPSVGLVGGKFVDEDPGAGTPGSLIPSAWGNAVTEEILNAIQAAGFEPDEGNLSQLAAVFKWFAGGTTTTLSATTALTKTQCGLVLVNATAGGMIVTLPTANADLGVVEVVLRRIDATSNTLTIAAAGADKIMLDTTSLAAGQASTELLFAGDYLRLRSDGAGKWWCVGQAQLPGSLNTGFVVYSEAGSFTFTVPAVLRSGRRQAFVTVIGGGGGGGNSTGTGTGQAGSGGGGAGVSKKRIDLAGVNAVTVTVGAGGAAQVTGGTSSFGTYLSATGGNAAGPSRGSAGVGIGGDLNDTLGYGFQRHTNGTAQVSGKGAGVGGGASIENGTIVGDTALSFGCGGGGGTGGAAGGVGSRGLVSIEW